MECCKFVCSFYRSFFALQCKLYGKFLYVTNLTLRMIEVKGSKKQTTNKNKLVLFLLFYRLFLGPDPSSVVLDCWMYFAAIPNLVPHLFLHMLPAGLL